VKLVLSVIITASIVFAMKKGGLKFIPDGGNFDQVRWWAIPVYLVTLIINSVFRATRWRFLLRSIADVPKKRLLSVSWIGFAAILVMPFRIGELVRPYMLRTAGKREASGKIVGAITMPAATGSVVAERVVDGLYLSIVLAIALIVVPHLEPLPEKVVGLPVSVAQVRHAGFLMVGVFSAALVVIAVFYAARDFARRATLAVFGVVSRKLGEKLASMAENLADGFHFFSRGKDAFGFLVETSIYWFFNAFGTWLLALGCGVVHANGLPITFGESCAVMGMVCIAILVPGPPGLLGTFQLGLYAGMTMYFPTDVVVGPGAAFVFLIYILQFGWTVLAAAFFLVTDKTNWQKLEEAEGIIPPSDDVPERASGEKLAHSASPR
jgi:uncharacterized protein (TIRG00374 family)